VAHSFRSSPRGLGSAQKEFKKGLEEGHSDEDDSKKSEKSKPD